MDDTSSAPDQETTKEPPPALKEWAAEEIEGAIYRRRYPEAQGTKTGNAKVPTPAIKSGKGSGTAKTGNITTKMKLSSEYRQKPDGIWYLPPGENSMSVRICGPLEVVAQTRNDEGASWGRLLEWQDGDGRQHRWAMPMSLLAGDGAEIRAYLLDRGCYVSPTSQGRAKFLDFLATTNVEARAFAVGKVGWLGGAFVLPDRTIGDSETQRVIYQGPDAADHAYRSMGTLDRWKANVADYGRGNSRIAVSLSTAFVGPLLSLLDEEGGGINLRGSSSIGKSTALFAASSVWGGPSFVRQWRATSNGLEGVCVQHNETFLPLDEVAQLDPREAPSVAYTIANGSGKARAARSGSLRSPAKWRVFFLSSGEISLADLAGRDARGTKRSAAGQEIRILDCAADAGAGLGLFEALHDAPNAETLSRLIKEGAASDYGVAGPAYVGRMVSNLDETAVSVKRDIDSFVAMNVPANANGQVARAARRFGLIAAAGELAARLEVLPWPSGEATAACATVFRQWLSERGGTGSAEDREAIAKVRGYLEMYGSSRFEAVDADEEASRINNRAGFWREGEKGREYLFLAETWKAEVCAGMDAARVARVLADHGMLRKDSAGKNSVTITLPAGIGKTRCYVINSSIFEGEV